MRRYVMCLFIGMLTTAVSVHALAQPVVVETGWTLTRTIAFSRGRSAHFNPQDTLIYVASRDRAGGDGIFTIDAADTSTKLVDADRVAAMLINGDGNVFFSEDYSGIIYRVAHGTTTKETWVEGFHGGDDDPVGMAIAPAGHSSGVINPGDALVADRGHNGTDEIWRWSVSSAENETALHTDDGTLIDAIGVAISTATIYVVDSGLTDPGAIYTVGPGGVLAALSTSQALDTPSGVVLDPRTQDLLVVDRGSGKVLRVTSGGTVSEVISGLTVIDGNWSGIDITGDGQQLLITGEDAIYLFTDSCIVSPPGGANDCDGNGVADSCDIADGTQQDCNTNEIPDSCEISDGTSQDCDANQIPDECQTPAPCGDGGVVDMGTDGPPPDLGLDGPAITREAGIPAPDSKKEEPAHDSSSGCCSMTGSGATGYLPLSDLSWLIVLGLFFFVRRRGGRSRLPRCTN